MGFYQWSGTIQTHTPAMYLCKCQTFQFRVKSTASVYMWGNLSEVHECVKAGSQYDAEHRIMPL